MIANDDYSSWYDRVSKFLILVWFRKRNFCKIRDQLVRFLRVTSLLNAGVVSFIKYAQSLRMYTEYKIVIIDDTELPQSYEIPFPCIYSVPNLIIPGGL